LHTWITEGNHQPTGFSSHCSGGVLRCACIWITSAKNDKHVWYRTIPSPKYKTPLNGHMNPLNYGFCYWGKGLFRLVYVTALCYACYRIYT
jgi:hypothetical protein